MNVMKTTGKLLRLRGLVITGLVLSLGAGTALSDAERATDSNICNAIEDDFHFDKAIPFDKIDVACADGIVTLKGTTNNILAKRRATRIAETIRGVRSVVNRINVDPVGSFSSGALQRSVETALLADPATDSYEINVSANDDGHVRLSGTVESWQEKQLVEKVAMGVKGVTKITNTIDVQYETERPDFEIKREIEKALKWNTLVDQEFVDVSVDDGKVTLTGTVGSAAEARQARYDAWVAGVTDVDSSGLKIQDWADDPQTRNRRYVSKPADEIRMAINEANVRDPRVKMFNVEPIVTGSTVTLRGKVDNIKAKRAAARNARNTAGVARVLNRLKVRPAGQRSDEQIEDSVRQSLLRDPYVDRYDITVNIVDGTAHLTGTVDSYFEKAEAEETASRVNGVVDVSNGLTVVDVNRPIVYNPYVYNWYPYDYGWYDYDPANVAKADFEIRNDIESELWWSPFVDSDEVTVSVEDGVAVLTGNVDSWSERRAAAESAIEGGAVRVENNLDVAMN